MPENSSVSCLLRLAELEAYRRGLGPLKARQREVLEHLARERSVFAALPTGYGKSLCAWMPAAAWGWRVWVISPLVSLIEDQAMACRAIGLNVLAWHGRMSPAEQREGESRMAARDWQVCFLAPERLEAWDRSGFLEAARCFGFDPQLLVIDELHCLEEWRSFRSGYLKLADTIHRRFRGRGTPLLGLSASLPLRESDAWMRELCGDYESVHSGLGRENLALHVVPLEAESERWMLLLSALRDLRSPESAIVYCATRDEADEASRWLRSAGVESVAYHAGLSAGERSARTLAFRGGRLRVVCATSAFGMGIDYPHVSRVIHLSMPRDLESYWQEVGRAGRSGRAAEGIVFWRRSEIARVRRMDRLDEAQRFLAVWKAWASGRCRKQAVAERLGILQSPCGKCDTCGFASVVLSPRSTPAWWTEFPADLGDWIRESHIVPGEVKTSLDSTTENLP